MVKERDWNGKVVGFGLPARREIRPGVFSRGNKPLTVLRDQGERLQENHHEYSLALGLRLSAASERNGV